MSDYYFLYNHNVLSSIISPNELSIWTDHLSGPQITSSLQRKSILYSPSQTETEETRKEKERTSEVER